MPRRGMNANVPTRWLTDADFLDLSGGAFAVFVRSLMYGVEHESDGAIPAKALRLLLPHDAEASEVAAELVDSGLWEQTEAGFQVIGWDNSQTPAADLAQKRAQNAERQRKFQRAKRGSNASVTQPPQIRTDEARADEAKADQTTSGEAEYWPVAPIPDALAGVAELERSR